MLPLLIIAHSTSLLFISLFSSSPYPSLFSLFDIFFSEAAMLIAAPPPRFRVDAVSLPRSLMSP